jgi:hypothetical protein
MQTECVFLMPTVNSVDDNVQESVVGLLLQEKRSAEVRVQILSSSPMEEEVLGDKAAVWFKTIGQQKQDWGPVWLNVSQEKPQHQARVGCGRI